MKCRSTNKETTCVTIEWWEGEENALKGVRVQSLEGGGGGGGEEKEVSVTLEQSQKEQ